MHRREDVVLDPTIPYIPSFYVVTDTTRAADGYSPTWLPHIWRVRAEPLSDSQEYKQILESVVKKGFTGQDLASTYAKMEEITQKIRTQGAKDVETRNFNSDSLFIQTNGTPLTTDNLQQWPFNDSLAPPNQDIKAPEGTRFPENPEPGDYFLRTDYDPPRMFMRLEYSWQAQYDCWRDRPWSPANRTLENYLNDTQITELSSDPADQFDSRQPINNPVPPKIKLPRRLNEITQEEENLEND